MPTTTPTTDATLPGFKETQNRDARFRKECKDFADLCAKVRAAGKSREEIPNGLVYALVFEARNGAGPVGKESLDALARAGKVRKGLYNEDVRPAVASLLALAAKGGALAEEEFAAREAEFFAAVGGRADAVFRRLVAVAFPAHACAAFTDGEIDAVLRGLVAAGRAEAPAAGATWFARCRAVHDALRAEWTWPDAITRCVFARRLAAAVAETEADAAETEADAEPKVRAAPKRMVKNGSRGSIPTIDRAAMPLAG
jgi:hypothetical protein